MRWFRNLYSLDPTKFKTIRNLGIFFGSLSVVVGTVSFIAGDIFIGIWNVVLVLCNGGIAWFTHKRIGVSHSIPDKIL